KRAEKEMAGGFAPATRNGYVVTVGSHFPGAHLGNADRRYPWVLRPGDALAGDLDIEQVWLALERVLARARQCLAQLGRIVNHFAVHAEALGDRSHVHVGVAEIVVDELAGLHHAAAWHV